MAPQPGHLRKHKLPPSHLKRKKVGKNPYVVYHNNVILFTCLQFAASHL